MESRLEPQSAFLGLSHRCDAGSVWFLSCGTNTRARTDTRTRGRARRLHTDTDAHGWMNVETHIPGEKGAGFSRNNRACYSSSGSAHQSEPTEVNALRGGTVSNPRVTTKTKDCSGLALHNNRQEGLDNCAKLYFH